MNLWQKYQAWVLTALLRQPWIAYLGVIGIILIELTVAGGNLLAAWSGWTNHSWPVQIAANCVMGLFCLKLAADVAWRLR